MIIDDGKGSGYSAEVDAQQRLQTKARTETETRQATNVGDAYNINTANITFTAAGSLLYILNNEDRDLLLETVIIGVGTGTTSDMGELYITKNDTAGDLITDQTAVTINQNRNFGSSKTLAATIYQGKSGGTATGGSDVVYVYTGTNTRVTLPINLTIPKGSSVSVTYDPKLSSGSIKAYCAVITHLREAT